MRASIEFTDPNNSEKSLSLVKESENAPGELWLYTEGGEGMAVSEAEIFKLLDKYYKEHF